MNLTRRTFIASATAVVAAGAGLGLAACKTPSAAEGPATWTATPDDSLECLTVQVSGGNVVAMPGDGWAPRDGFIQLQLSGGSIPGEEIESAVSDGGVLAVKLKSGDGPSTLDLVLTEFRLEPPEGISVEKIESVAVDYGDGEPQELQKAYE